MAAKPKVPLTDPRKPAVPPPPCAVTPLPDLPPTSAFDADEDADSGIEQSSKASKFVQLTLNYGLQVTRKPYGATLFERYLATEDVVNVKTREVSTPAGEWTKWKRLGFYSNIIWACSAVLREQTFIDINNAPDKANIQALMMLIINRDIGMRDMVMDVVEEVLTAVVEDGELMPTTSSRPPLHGATEHTILQRHELIGRLRGSWARKLNVPAVLNATEVRE